MPSVSYTHLDVYKRQMGFTSGLSILIAQRFGAEDEEGIRCSFAAGIILSIALTIVMTFFAVALVRPAMELLQTPEEIP